MKKALGIDLGGTKIAVAIVDDKGNIFGNVERFPTPKTKKEIVETLKNIISKYENEVDFFALATAGAVNNENTRVIGSTANLPKGYKDIDFQSLTNKKFFLENDANCAAWAEYKIGASKGCKNSVMLTLGTGVGGGIIIDGKLLKGKSGSAGEMHFMMSRNQERSCTCGTFDCFEAYASGNGLRKTAIETTKNPDVTTYDVIQGAKDNVDTCLKALEIWQNDIALGILGLANIFDPDCFVLSGSMEKFVDTKKIEKFVNKNTVTTPTKIFHAKAGNYSGLIGAALLGFEKI
ncbi:MAG: ROK family protein [Candidatus Gastranaerophilales bacterium]|nr:ROK family protein [Candidatus Gastranaerophilales bacterium]